MLNRFPYNLYLRQTGAAEQNFEGNFEETASSAWVLHSECRDEINGAGKTIALPNGENIVFAGVVFLPASAELIPIKSEIMVCDTDVDYSKINNQDYMKRQSNQGKIRLSGSVKSFEKSRLNIRLWV